MSKKKPFVLRMDPDTLAALERWAADEFRSLNGQLEWILHKALKEAGRLPPRTPAQSDSEAEKASGE